MERVSTLSFEQPLDLSAQSTTTSSTPRLFQQSFPFNAFNLDSRQLTVPSLYSHNQNYSVAVVSPRLGDDLVDCTYKKPVSLVSPRVEPESSTTPRRSKKSPSGSILDKSSVEYRKKRIKNNEAARKSRQKKKETEVEMKRKMNDLRDESTLLRETINRLNFLLMNQKCRNCSCPLTDKLYRYDMIPSLGIDNRPSSTQKR
ncbi:hypothetical protein V9T40_000351 [Parthenolecanium corni]|uniref:BZIP domain-containing protein n=1 Tax=Parthenolecanium corni TaxID=536013 RepID=A0AAN9T9D4_9HEMI